jgi:hypothetical protein
VRSEWLSLEREQVLKEVYGLLRFDILQRKIDTEEKEAKSGSKTVDAMDSEKEILEKENN